ncbi:MAG: ribonuclease P protein component [Prolixibacteraceae bacterium]|nr:ribonuclease P protein component [Prolixibacteraceae bacterium]
MADRFTLKKKERLCSKILLDDLFKNGKSFFTYPMKFVYLESENPLEYPAKVAFSVPKKRFKKAVDRNLLRRRMKEAYRLNKYVLYHKAEVAGKYIVMLIIYSDNKALTFQQIEKGMVKGLCRFVKMLENK